MVLLEPSARSFTLFKEELALGYDKGTDVMLMTNEKIKYLVASMRHNQAENGEQPSVSGGGGAQLLQLAQQPGVRLLDVSVARENSAAAAERNDAQNLFSTTDFHAGVSAVRMTRTLEQRTRRILMKSTNRKSTTTTNRVRKRRKGLPVRWRQMCR